MWTTIKHLHTGTFDSEDVCICEQKKERGLFFMYVHFNHLFKGKEQNRSFASLSFCCSSFFRVTHKTQRGK